MTKECKLIILIAFSSLMSACGQTIMKSNTNEIRHSLISDEIPIDEIKKGRLKLMIENVRISNEDVGARVFIYNRGENQKVRIGSIFSSVDNDNTENFIFSLEDIFLQYDNISKSEMIELIIEPFNFRDSTLSVNKEVFQYETIKLVN